jgi:hypothetical protein
LKKSRVSGVELLRRGKPPALRKDNQPQGRRLKANKSTLGQHGHSYRVFDGRVQHRKTRRRKTKNLKPGHGSNRWPWGAFK